MLIGGRILRNYISFVCWFQGPANKNSTCQTCGAGFHECPGHFGYLNLVLPVFNVGYISNILDILKCICKVSGFLAFAHTYICAVICSEPFFFFFGFSPYCFHVELCFFHSVCLWWVYK